MKTVWKQRAVMALLLVVAAGCPDATNPVNDGNGLSRTAIESSGDERSSPSSSRPSAEESTSGKSPFTFRTIGAEAGLDFERDDDIRGLHRILEANGGGAGLFDFDRDGRLDVFLTNGCRLPRRDDDRATPSQLFRNRGDLQFVNVSGVSLLHQFGYAQGCAVGDFDADGFDDLYVTAFGRNSLWRNNGDGTFADVTEATATQVPQWSSSAAFADLDADGDLDLYVTNYLDESDESPKLCPNEASPDGYEQCSPAVFDGVDDALFLSDGRGGFFDATASAGLAGLKGKGLGVVVCNLDGQGLPEIYVANDGQANFLFSTASERNQHAEIEDGPTSLVYRELALNSNVALNEVGYAQASMGIAAGDYDASGTTDLYLTHFYGDTNTLYSNRGDLLFDDTTRMSRLGAASRQTLGWGTAFVDLDNDGWLDLIATNGHVDDRTWRLDGGEPFAMPPNVYRNLRDGSFAEVTSDCGDYFTSSWNGRGLAIGDLDRDGRPDAVVSHQLSPSVALRNETDDAGGAIVLQLVGSRSNRNGYGARVEVVPADSTAAVPKLSRELVGGGSFQSASAPEIHLGIGDRDRVTILVHWPGGVTDQYENVAAGYWLVVEGGGIFPLSSSGIRPAGGE